MGLLTERCVEGGTKEAVGVWRFLVNSAENKVMRGRGKRKNVKNRKLRRMAVTQAN